MKLPDPLPPLFWNAKEGADINLSRIQFNIDAAEGLLGGGHKIDEASILVPLANGTNNPRNEVERQLNGSGWYHDNSARDRVYTTPFNTTYAVAYDFYRHPKFEWRIEVMRITGAGVSPLHAGLMSSAMYTGYYPVPHLSYKPEPVLLTEFEKAALPDSSPESLALRARRRGYAREMDYMAGESWMHAQTCQSSYGAFSYWVHASQPKHVYVKPRVNLRDIPEEQA